MYMARILASHYPCRISNMSTHMLWNSCNKLGKFLNIKLKLNLKCIHFYQNVWFPKARLNLNK